MLTDAQILERMRQAFAPCARPDHFGPHLHCEECADHDQVLRARDLDTLSLEDVSNPGWDPICFASPEAFRYYLPALARLALAQPTEQHGWYGPSQIAFTKLLQVPDDFTQPSEQTGSVASSLARKTEPYVVSHWIYSVRLSLLVIPRRCILLLAGTVPTLSSVQMNGSGLR